MSPIKVETLSNMVKNSQFAQLKEFGGTEALATQLGCFDTVAGLPSNFDFARQKILYGKNELRPPHVPPYMRLLLENFQDLTIIILSIAAVVSLVLGLVVDGGPTSWVEGTAILVAVTLVTNFQAYTDWSNAHTFKLHWLSLEGEKRVLVMRNNGTIVTIHPKDLVVGDILRVEMGCILPADGVLAHGNNIKMDESALTGESKLMEKRAYEEGMESKDATSEEEKKVTPFLLSGTSVVDGQGRMLVVAVGANSLQGNIMAQVASQDAKNAPTESHKSSNLGASKRSANPSNLANTSDRDGSAKKATALVSPSGEESLVAANERSSAKKQARAGSKKNLDALHEDEEDHSSRAELAAVEVDDPVLLPELDLKVLMGQKSTHHNELNNVRSRRFSIRDGTIILDEKRLTTKTLIRQGSVRNLSSLNPPKLLVPVCCRPKEVTASNGTLSDKLDQVVILIGKFGVTIATLVFIVMVVRFSIQQYAYGGYCPTFQANLTMCMEAQTQYGCVVSPSNTTCIRVWQGSDASTLLRFFITAVTILVVVVPEGLPLAVTLSLSLSMSRMARENNQVKNMDSSETMGSATTICTDKTGTLTQNRMTMVRLHTSDGANFTKGAGSTTLGETFHTLGTNSMLRGLLVQASCLATNPGSSVDGASQKGNPTDCALLRLVHEMGESATAIRAAAAPVVPNGMDYGVYVYQFTSSRKRGSIVVAREGGGYRVYCMGAPQYVLAQCNSLLNAEGQAAPLDATARAHIDGALEDCTRGAMRTLAIAYRDLAAPPPGGWSAPASTGTTAGGRSSATEDVNSSSASIYAAETNLTLLAVAGIEDPLRPTVITAVHSCYSAGVDVRMCTGDALDTAVAISIQCGILNESNLVTLESGYKVPKECFAMTGAEFEERIFDQEPSKPKVWRRAYNFDTKTFGEMLAPPFRCYPDSGEKILNMKKFDEVWPKLRVLARCLPEDKLTLVKGLKASKLFKSKAKVAQLEQEFGIRIFPDFQVVAVTGDGTNDAPALKAADVGFAMGITGTDIAKQACDIILMDDNFSSVVTAIKWGRNVFDSISKFVQFQLTVNIAAVFVACLGAFVFDISPLQPVQMLWVNLIMDALASFALATDSPSPELLDRDPYGKQRPVISRVMAINILGQAVFQCSLIVALLFNASWIPSSTDWSLGKVTPFPPIDPTILDSDISVHWTVVFNTFVMLQLANQINCRKLQTPERLRSSWAEWHGFSNFFGNKVFLLILLGELGGQVLIILFGGLVFMVAPLSISQWVFCVGLGALSFVWQFVVNAVILLDDSYRRSRGGGGGGEGDRQRRLRKLQDDGGGMAVDTIE